MNINQKKPRILGQVFSAFAISVLLSGCALDFLSSESNTSKSSTKDMLSTIKEKEKEKANINNETKFSSAEFGVKGSPRVTTSKSVRKGGGRYQIGKPYTIRGKKYYPKLDENLTEVGMASWYGPNFHGRLTANGEIYDQYALSAAHPTMPLPSYAKVTNLENNRSVIVRVNDRGPFHSGRVIDLSARASELLDYQNKGLAKVRVEYHAKARMDGLDESFLMASYKGPNKPKFEPFAKPELREDDTLIALAPIPQRSITPSNSIPSVKPSSSSAIEDNFSTATQRPTSILPTNLINNTNNTIYENVNIDKGTTPIHELRRIPLAYAQHANAFPTFKDYDEEYKKAFSYLGDTPNREVEISLGKFSSQDEKINLKLIYNKEWLLKFNQESNSISIFTTEQHANSVLHYARYIGLSDAIIK